MGESLTKKQKPLYKDPLVIIIIVLAFILLCRILFAINFRGVYVKGNSMNPTLYSGDYLYVNVYTEPDYGDIVVLEKEDWMLEEGETEKNIIKRVIAKGGDWVYMQDGVVYVMYSGTDEYVALEEDYVAAENLTPFYEYNTFDEYYVEEGKIFVLGDNRDHSSDSRHYGSFKLSSVVGVVTEWSLKYKTIFTFLH